MRSPRFAVTALRDFASSRLAAAGVAPTDADLVARSLVDADRAGIFSHGLLRLPLYLSALAAGGIDPQARPRVTREHGAVTVIDAGSAFGQVAMQEAVARAISLAPVHGMATVSVHGSTHFGAGRFWMEQLTEQGLAGILTSTTGPVAAPFGGARPVLGTNPLTIGLPSSGTSPLLVDLATTAGAYGKVVSARNEGTPIPAGWAVDSSGAPTTDPLAALDGGALVPFGGHKGSGLSVMIEALSAALSSASFAMDTVDIWNDPGSRMNTGHLLIALDTAAFGDASEAREKVARLQDSVRGSNEGAAVHAPGDLEHAALQENAETVPLAPSTIVQLGELSVDESLPFPTPIEEGTS